MCDVTEGGDEYIREDIPETERGAVISHSLIALRRRNHGRPRRPGGAAGPEAALPGRPQAATPGSTAPPRLQTPSAGHLPRPPAAGITRRGARYNTFPRRPWAGHRAPTRSSKVGAGTRGEDSTGGSSGGSSPPGTRSALQTLAGKTTGLAGLGEGASQMSPDRRSQEEGRQVTRH